MLVLVPAYEPDDRLVRLIEDLGAHLPDARILVVDDGSGPSHDRVFEDAAAAGADVMRQPENRGKGAALKLGFAWAVEHVPGSPITTADCDGQHRPDDIAAVADRVAPRTLVLGGRRFTGDVPLRSKLGNAISRTIFRAVTGSAVHDTQTGLRAFAPDLLPWLAQVEGDRFEYEFNQLLQARRAGVELVEVPIATVYLDENESSHFRPLQDSLRIYAPLVKFAGSSLIGFVVDLVALLVFMQLTGHLLGSVVAARLLSIAVNFAVNRGLVFRDSGSPAGSATRYLVLAGVMLAANAGLMSLLVTRWGLPLLPAKIAVELVLFVLSYGVQHRLVFRGRPRGAPPA
ncbi:MAG TPA: glycosyltransferase [Propionibacterium sp.]|nr:glycosyltransferase [Propionibacterium sp.]